MSVVTRTLWWTPQARPVRISALMELYERNYRMIEQLIPDLELPYREAWSTSGSDLRLRLTVLERGRYTTAFRLTYEFAQSGDAPAPDLSVRVYRDARLAEALTCPGRPPWKAAGEGDPAAWRFLDDQWGRNLMLHKWLQYLLDHGHGFGLAGRPRAAAAA